MPDRPTGRHITLQHWVGGVLLISALLTGMVTRCLWLDLRVVHGDEANQAVKTARLLEGETYRYDPGEHHGPTLYFLTVPLLRLAGATTLADTEISHYRLVPALAGTLLVGVGGVLAWSCAGPFAGGAAAWFLVLSNGVTFYSRYYIQEILLTLFIAAAALALTWLWRHPRGHLPWLGLGISMGLAHATKETVVYFLFTGMLSFVAAWAYGHPWKQIDPPPGRPGALKASARHMWIGVMLALVSAVLVSGLFYTSFLTNLPGAWHALTAYATYLHRAGGQGSSGMHDKPWYYYLFLLTWYQPMAGPRWSEAPVLGLAAVAGVDAFFGRQPAERGPSEPDRRVVRFLFLWIVLSFGAFSLTPYKTPWNILTPLALCCVLAGVGAARVAVMCGRLWKPAVAVGIAITLAAMAWEARQAWLGNVVYPADARNPYVYAHTTSAIRKLEERIRDLSALHPDGQDMPVYVVRLNGDYWPLPWYLRELRRVGYWTRVPDSLPVPVIIAGSEVAGALADKLGDRYFSETQALRPGVLLRVFIRRDLWDQFIATRSTGSAR
ncbi:MAG TPA: TIGR03663 family protein [Candidatus Hydrogenedentes bacterium]|nr:TIGR03663 family protein [Candidatus Hydrogenedentota bacterium]